VVRTSDSLKDLMARTITSFHEAVFKASGGRLLGSFGGMPVLILTTTGRTSGKRRSTMLTAPVREDDRIVLVASYGGDDRHPAWFVNLRAHPEVTVTMGGRTRPMRARVASAEERAELWSRVTSAYKGYEGYQKRTSREIPLVILEP
jgi:deazaflavin-dependent oxidoreductase (nitroreductase family)